MATPLDYYSITEKLEEIEYRNYEDSKDEYYIDYADQFNELSCIAGELYNELERIVQKIDFTWNLPARRVRELGKTYRVYWFDTVAALINETDMMLLLEEEGVYDPDDEETERNKRIRAVRALTKEQMLNLFREAFNFLMKYLKLLQAYEMLCGLVDELRYLHSFRRYKGEPLPPPTAYVE